MNGQFDASREGQLTEKSLSWGYWWVTHKIQVRQWFAIGLGIFGFVTLGYGLFGFADWYFGSGVKERLVLGQMTRQLIPYSAYNEARAPQPLEQLDSYALAAGVGKYDLLASVKNPNSRWMVRFTYHFEDGATKTESRPGFILPGDTTYLEQLGYKSEGALSRAMLVMDNPAWQRVDPHLTQPNYETWSAARLSLLIKDPAFVRPAAGDLLGTSRATFTVQNETAFSYYKVGLLVTLWGDGGLLLGTNRITISDVRSGESRPVEAVWYGDVAGVKSVEVKPVIDIFDTKNYIPVGK
jgi:hypothetical protein